MNDRTSPKGTSSVSDAAWRAPSPRSRTEVLDEQDRAAGGRESRRLRLEDGASRYASIELKKNHKQIYAYLRYSNGGKTVNRYVGHVDQGSRFDNLKQAWAVVLERNLLGGDDQAQ